MLHWQVESAKLYYRCQLFKRRRQEMTKIIQISDTHLVGEDKFVSKTLETAAPLEDLVGRISEIQLEVGAIDAIIFSGDISDDGSAESYKRFKSILSPLELPIFLVPGNHDVRSIFRSEFLSAGYLPEAGKLNWHQAVADVHLIGLDTLIEGQGGGELDGETLKFLEYTLDKLENAPAILMLHHPPFKSGIEFMDSIGLHTVREPLGEILRSYCGELIVVCGHIHMNIITQLGGHTVIAAPSTCSSFVYNIHNDAPVGVLKQEGGLILHDWSQGFKSIRIEAMRGEVLYPF